MAEKKVKVIKDGVVKYINQNDLEVYIAMGWTEVKDFSTTFKKV